MRPVHVVVVAYHAPCLLDRCLSGISGAFSVSIIDNSSDDAVRAVALKHGAHYTDSGANLGFAAGVNVALRALSSGTSVDILLLNPDAVASPDTIRTLSDYLHARGNDRLGAVSPMVTGVDAKPQRVMWPFPNPLRAGAEAVGLGRLNTARDFATGAVLLLRWEALRDVGLFDERFFLYAEETDWQRRAKAHGWSTSVVPHATAAHLGAGTSGDTDHREVLFHAGTETYVRKWFGSVGWGIYRTFTLFGATARAALLRGDRRAAAARRALIYARGPRKMAGF